MTKQAWIAAIIALVLGVVIGHFLIPSKSGEDGERGRGLIGDRGPPSQLPQIMTKPEGEWPKFDCAGMPKAIDMLDQIYFRASHAANTGTLDPEEGRMLLESLYRCTEAHAAPSPAHCGHVQEALNAANADDWLMSRSKLDHEDE